MVVTQAFKKYMVSPLLTKIKDGGILLSLLKVLSSNVKCDHGVPSGCYEA